MTLVIAAPIEEIAEAIANAVAPEKIILFGSQARNETTPDSDVDLLVIEREPFGANRSRRAELHRIHEALWDFATPIDVLLYSLDEVAEWSDSLNHIIGQAMRDGKVVYERP